MMKYKIYKIENHGILTRSLEFESCTVTVPKLVFAEIDIEGIQTEHNCFEYASLEVEKIKKMGIDRIQLTIIPFIQL